MKMEDSKKYNHMENIFQYINKHYVSLDEDQIKKNNKVLQYLLNSITTKMKERSPLFKKLFTKIFYGGSYYDGLKIGQPEEYDCDLLLTIPKLCQPELTKADTPGFVQLQMTKMDAFKKQPEFQSIFRELEELLDGEKYFSVEKVKQWMESIFDKTFNKFTKDGKYHSFTVEGNTYYFSKTKGGPAFTVHISDAILNESFFMDIDLVPCFVFQEKNWPSEQNFRKNPSTSIQTFFVVPKKPTKGSAQLDRCWRLSFQEQEAEIIGQRQSLKPALKLLKKLRDRYKHSSISSYFLKTIFLWEVEKSDDVYWKENLSTVFTKMLRKYINYLETKNIPYYWDKHFNLIADLNSTELNIIKNTMENILFGIENNISNPYVVAKYFIPKEDIPKLEENVPLGKKHGKRNVTVVDSMFSKCTNKKIESIEQAI